jgi:hypothetical protein
LATDCVEKPKIFDAVCGKLSGLVENCAQLVEGLCICFRRITLFGCDLLLLGSVAITPQSVP